MLYMLDTKLPPAPCWNWDVIFAPCWNWAKMGPMLAPCQHGAFFSIFTRPVLELGAPCRNWAPRAGTGLST